MTFIALVEYAVVNVRLREDAERKAKEKKLQEAEENLRIDDECNGLDETTLWLMGNFNNYIEFKPEGAVR